MLVYIQEEKGESKGREFLPKEMTLDNTEGGNAKSAIPDYQHRPGAVVDMNFELL